MSTLASLARSDAGPAITALALVIKITLLLALAWLVHAALGRVNPRWRVLVWRLTALGIVLLILLAGLPPMVRLPLLRQTAQVTQIKQSDAPPSAAAAPLEPKAARSQSLARTAEHAPQPKAATSRARTSADVSPVASAVAVPGDPFAPAIRTRSVPEAATIAAARRRSLATWLLIVWCGGLAVGVFRTSLAAWQLRRLRARAVPAPAWIGAEAAHVALRLGVKRNFGVAQTRDVKSPCLIAPFRPLILLPDAQCGDERRDELAPILAHEIGHLHGHDLFWNALVHVLSLPLWFHPLVWRIRLAHADACDAVSDLLAAECVGDAGHYGRTLARLALAAAGHRPAVGLAMARPSRIARRIAAIRTGGFRTRLPRWLTMPIAMLALAAVGLIGGVAISRSAAESPEPQQANKPAAGGADKAAVERQTVRVSGRVVDRDGRPIAGAVAHVGLLKNYGAGPHAKTDARGRFAIEKCEPGESLVTVQAEGFSPYCEPLDVTEPSDTGDVTLDPGHTLTVRVVDLQGKPLAGFHVAARVWRDHRTLDFNVTTNAAGEVVWKSAPADAVLFDIYGAEHMAVRQTPLTAGEETRLIKLHPALSISGRVTDASTGEPIAKFHVRHGMIATSDNRPYWPSDEAMACDNGRYSRSFSEPAQGHLLQVYAQGYEPATSRIFMSSDGDQTFDVALTPGQGPSGLVVLPDGEPAAGAEVGLATPGKRATLNGGRFNAQNQADVVITDAEGRFSFPSQGDEPFLLIVLHDAGFADVLHDELAESNRIELTPWGRLVGWVMQGNQPDADHEVVFHSDRIRKRRLHGYLFGGYDHSAKTDESGRFSFERVVPGGGEAARVVVTEFMNSWQQAFGWQTPIEIRSGEISYVTVGGSGSDVVGQVTLDAAAGVKPKWTLNEPAKLWRWDKAENQPAQPYTVYYGKLSEAGQFQIADVPAGDYQLTVPVNNPPSPEACGAGTEIGQAKLVTSVPEPRGRDGEPFDLGEIQATLFDTLDAGELAPDWVAEQLGGGTLRMNELRGKLVLLDFWATWCVPCRALEPELQKLHAEFGDDPRFALVGLSCDADAGTVKRYVDENAIGWRQALVGGGYSPVANKYTVRTFPTTFLIGPNGRVLAKNLRGDALRDAVASALANDALFALPADATARFPVVRFPVVRFDVVRFDVPAEQPSGEQPPEKRPALVVLDDTDPSFNKEQPHDDRLRLLNVAGETVWQQGSLNCIGSSGGVHRVAVDRRRGRIYVCENGADRILAFNLTGQKLWQIEQNGADVLAVDQETGNLWSSGGGRLDQGETVVFDPRGKELAAYPYRAVDMALDERAGAVWLVGYQIIKLNREGELLFRKPVDGYCAASVSVDPADGGVWIAERNHPDVPRSKNRVWLLAADGTVRREIDLKKQDVFVIAGLPGAGEAWISGYQTPLRRATAAGTISEPLPFGAKFVCVAPNGDFWAATKEAAVRFDASGKVLATSPFRAISNQAWMAAF